MLALVLLYAGWGITDQSDFDSLAPEDYPVLSDLYAFMETFYPESDKTGVRDVGMAAKELALRAHAHGVQPQQDAPQHLRRIELPLTPVKRLVPAGA